MPWEMLEVTFSCPLCSRIFLRDRPYQEGVIPPHLDALLGQPCGASGRSVRAYLEIPDHAHPAPPHGLEKWPRYRRPG